MADKGKTSVRIAYAHSVKGFGTECWEKLPRHLFDVGSETANRAAKFGCAAMGTAIGQLHDFGKFKEAFQHYLHGKKVEGKAHSAAGALYALKHFDQIGRFMAHPIAGHHAGLQDDLLAADGRLASNADDLKRAQAGLMADAQAFVPPTRPNVPNDLKLDVDWIGFQYAFIIRMLFSCLVDADRICTERFYADQEKRDVERGPAASLSELLTAFTGWMTNEAERREGDGKSRTAVNLRRAKILADVGAHSADPQGVFTLTVPTGGGKTLTGLDFALRHAVAHDLDRVIVVVPFTSVIEQTAAVYRNALGPLATEILEHHSAFDEEALRGENRQGLAKLQLAMENWDARIVVTTAVQFFESLFSNRPTQCRKLHNIAKSVVILDEAQTIPLKLLRPCVAALQELVRNYGASIVLSTATQPALLERCEEPGRSFKGGFAADRVTELVDDVPALFESMRRVRVRHIGEQTDGELVGRMQDIDQALCVVSTRRHARDLYFELREARPEARHLSTMMHAAHRSRVLHEIRADLLACKPCQVVSTSLIEAGVDVDFRRVLRAETGLDQIAQSAGRLNREGRWAMEDSLLLIFKAAGQKPPKDLEINAAIAINVIRRFCDDGLEPAAIEAYFTQLYWTRGPEDLDRSGLLGMCKGKAHSLDFPFETIAKAMRLIDTAMQPIIVANDDESRGWLAMLKDTDCKVPLRTITRGLQRHIVGLPKSDMARLRNAKAAALVREDAFGDQFVELVNTHLYRPHVGLDCSDPYFMEAGALTV